MLIVEDGSGVANSDSYQTLIEARERAAKYNIILPVNDTEAEALLRNGYLGLLTIERDLQGSRTHAIQTNIYPRIMVSVCVAGEPLAIDPESIPEQLKMSQLYQADAIQNGSSTNGTVGGQKLSGFDVKGVYSETYQDGSSDTINDIVQGVYNQMYPLTKVGFQQSPCGCGGYGNGLGRECMGFLR